jgi:hypothetical protein
MDQQHPSAPPTAQVSPTRRLVAAGVIRRAPGRTTKTSARFKTTGHDRYRIEQARAELAALDSLDLGDDHAVVRTLGRLEVALQQLVEMADEAVADR